MAELADAGDLKSPSKRVRVRSPFPAQSVRERANRVRTAQSQQGAKSPGRVAELVYAVGLNPTDLKRLRVRIPPRSQ